MNSSTVRALSWVGAGLGLFLGVEISAYSKNPHDFEDLPADGDYLDLPYRGLVHPRVNDQGPASGELGPFDEPVAARSDTEVLAARISPARAQGSRGTCSIFSATALLEAHLSLRRGWKTSQADFSEEWLEYLAMQNQTGDGSSSLTNFSNLLRFGTVAEASWPYLGETWKDTSTGLARQRCGSLEGARLTSCLLGHRDPRLLRATDEELLARSSPLFDSEFARIRSEARSLQQKELPRRGGQALPTFMVYDTQTVKRLLRQGEPLTLDVDFYYGAWNHSKAPSFGLKRNLAHWAEGLVGYPSKGSLDARVSKANPAGHSVLIVGYDDELVVTVPTQMEDGTVKDFTFKGVYYFKNSWGRDNFGLRTRIGGQNFPGYGMITQDYAQQFGSFYRLPL